jgi:hypothetical protein
MRGVRQVQGLPVMLRVMPYLLLLACPSNTEMMTPDTSSSSAMISALDGTFLSTKTATAAVTTGMAALHERVSQSALACLKT